MTNEEVMRIFGMHTYHPAYDRNGEATAEFLKNTLELYQMHCEAVGKSDKYGCKSCKYYDCENNQCLIFDIYCGEDFYCKIGVKNGQRKSIKHYSKSEQNVYG